MLDQRVPGSNVVEVTLNVSHGPVTLVVQLREQRQQTPPAPLRTTTMATALLRSVARSTRTATPRIASRNISSTSVRSLQPTVDEARKTGFDYHTVEDFHGMTAKEILAGPKEDPKMRHFTGKKVSISLLLVLLIHVLQLTSGETAS